MEGHGSTSVKLLQNQREEVVVMRSDAVRRETCREDSVRLEGRGSGDERWTWSSVTALGSEGRAWGCRAGRALILLPWAQEHLRARGGALGTEALMPSPAVLAGIMCGWALEAPSQEGHLEDEWGGWEPGWEP